MINSYKNIFNNDKKTEIDRYDNLMHKIDNIILESKKTQIMIEERRNETYEKLSKAEINKSKNCFSIESNYENNQTKNLNFNCINGTNNHLKSILFENGIKNEIKLDYETICEKYLKRKYDNNFKNKEKIEAKSMKEKKLLEKIDNIEEKLSFNLYGFINDIYDLSIQIKNKKNENLLIQEEKKTENFTEILSNTKIEEDKEWKKLNLEDNKNSINEIIFYKENLINNINGDFLAHQFMQILYDRSAAVYMNLASKKK